MTRFYIFLLRIILGAVFALLLSRFFFPGVGVGWIVGIAISLVGLAYVTEYFRTKRQGQN